MCNVYVYNFFVQILGSMLMYMAAAATKKAQKIDVEEEPKENKKTRAHMLTRKQSDAIVLKYVTAFTFYLFQSSFPFGVPHIKLFIATIILFLRLKNEFKHS